MNERHGANGNEPLNWTKKWSNNLEKWNKKTKLRIQWSNKIEQQNWAEKLSNEIKQQNWQSKWSTEIEQQNWATKLSIIKWNNKIERD